MHNGDPDTRGPTEPATRNGDSPLLALLLVGLGGAGGTGLRILVAALVPERTGLPVAILLINISGAFALGWLLERLHRGGRDDARHRLRLLVGTGFLGGFTTYSALAVDTTLLLAGRALVAGIGYPIVTVVGGFLAAWAGIAMGQRLPGRDRPMPTR